jgi:hypothetical protein
MASRVLCLALVFAMNADAAPLRVTHPKAQSASDQYFLRLLQLGLDKSESPYAMHEWAVPLKKGRALAEVVRGEHLDVAWAVTTRKRERELLAIRIPLDKGVSGWRIPLVHPQDHDRFRKVRTLADLSVLSAGLGFDWADTTIFRANGLPVVTGDDLSSLVRMLGVRRFDYIARSPAELLAERERFATLAVDPHIILTYPSAVYFFVRRDNAGLARALEKGLLKAVEDGSFDRLFHAAADRSLALAHIEARTAIALANPEMPGDMIARHPRLFLHIEDFQKAPPPHQ